MEEVHSLRQVFKSQCLPSQKTAPEKELEVLEGQRKFCTCEYREHSYLAARWRRCVEVCYWLTKRHKSQVDMEAAGLLAQVFGMH